MTCYRMQNSMIFQMLELMRKIPANINTMPKARIPEINSPSSITAISVINSRFIPIAIGKPKDTSNFAIMNINITIAMP